LEKKYLSTSTLLSLFACDRRRFPDLENAWNQDVLRRSPRICQTVDQKPDRFLANGMAVEPQARCFVYAAITVDGIKRNHGHISGNLKA
jgi:hypothetical protein